MALDRVVLALEPFLLAAAPGARVIERSLRRGVLGVALRAIQRVVAAVRAHAVRRHFDDALQAAEQRAIVADDDEAAAPAVECRAQPCAAGRVEVVGRFVEHEQARAGQQRADQRDACELAAAQRVGSGVGLHVVQARRIERRAQPFGEIPALADRVEVVRVGLALREPRKRRERHVELGNRGDALRAGRHVGVLLRDVRDGRLPVDRAGTRRAAARDQLREHALARAVAADDAGRHAVDDEVERIEQREAVVEAEGNVMKRDERAGRRGSSHEHLRKCVEHFARRAAHVGENI